MATFIVTVWGKAYDRRTLQMFYYRIKGDTPADALAKTLLVFAGLSLDFVKAEVILAG